MDEVNQLTEQILLLFRPNLNIDIHPHESYEAFVLVVGDAANLTAGDREDRVVRRTVRFKVESYIPGNVFRFTNTSEMKTLNFEQYIEETSGFQTLESFYAGGGAAFALNQLDNRGGGFTTVPVTQQIPTFTTTTSNLVTLTTTTTQASTSTSSTSTSTGVTSTSTTSTSTTSTSTTTSTTSTSTTSTSSTSTSTGVTSTSTTSTSTTSNLATVTTTTTSTTVTSTSTSSTSSTSTTP